jgi:hypothetical protein
MPPELQDFWEAEISTADNFLQEQQNSKNIEQVGSIGASGLRRVRRFPCQSAADRVIRAHNSAAEGAGQIAPSR